MLYFFYGDKKISAKATKLFESLKVKKPDASFFNFNEEDINESVLSEALESQGLFEKKIVCLFKGVLQNKELKEKILEKVSQIGKSENIFIWYENDLRKEEISLLKKSAEKSDIEEKEKKKFVFGQTEEGKGNGQLNIFSLADAFGKRDKKTLWALFLKAKESASAEEIHGVLFWQLKAIAAAHLAKTAEEADLKPFVFSKAKGFSKNYSLPEIQNLSLKFVEMYHDAHRGKVDFLLSLEKMILSI